MIHVIILKNVVSFYFIPIWSSKAWEKPEICTKITLWHSFTRLSTFQGLFIPVQKVISKNLYKMLTVVLSRDHFEERGDGQTGLPLVCPICPI